MLKKNWYGVGKAVVKCGIRLSKLNEGNEGFWAIDRRRLTVSFIRR